jgi:hypothetical protein
MKMDTVSSSETLAYTIKSTRQPRYNPEDQQRQIHRCENLKSYSNEHSGSVKSGKFLGYLKGIVSQERLSL